MQLGYPNLLYNENDNISYSGLSVVANYSDGSSKTITNYSISPSAGTKLTTAGTVTVSISYTEGEVTKSTSFTIKVYGYITFSSSNEFTIATANNTKNWNGTLEYSTDKATWSTWAGTPAISSSSTGSTKYLYIRGTGNTTISGVFVGGYLNTYPWKITGSNVSVSGNIMTLLDYEDPNNAAMSEICFAGMFSGCTALSSVSKNFLPAISLSIGCYCDMFKECTSLTTAPELPATELADSCYSGMFFGCTSLTTAPKLPATTLADYCYSEMFSGCTSLIVTTNNTGNKIFNCPSTTGFTDPVDRMFTSTATNIGTPDSGITYYFDEYLTFTGTDVTVTPSKYWTGSSSPEREYSKYDGTSWSPWADCFDVSGNPKKVGGDGITKIRFRGKSCYRGSAKPLASDPWVEYDAWDISGSSVSVSGNIMTLLDYTNPPTEFVTTGANNYCFAYMFLDQSALTNASKLTLPATTLAYCCYYDMFEGCTSLKKAPTTLPATALAEYCYNSMFYDCSSLETAPTTLPATKLADQCYSGMFSGCTSLKTAPALPATTLDYYCYYAMFANCTLLKSVSEKLLPATTLAEGCYSEMFSFSGLTTAPALPATKMKSSCYNGMFAGCTSLSTAPALNATSLAESCYCCMFYGCTSLSTAPVLNATSLAEGCYKNMFSGCTSLTSAPALPATTLAKECYCGMFGAIYEESVMKVSGCTGLTSIPKLPATTLAKGCYYGMFYGCTKIKLSETQTGEYQTSYRVPYSENGTDATDARTDMFKNTGGTFTGTPAINTTYYTSNTIIPAT